jgi:hypothetical protein
MFPSLSSAISTSPMSCLGMGRGFLDRVARGDELRGREAAGLRGLDADDEGPPSSPPLTEGDDDAGPGCLEKKPRSVDCFLELVDEGGADDLVIVARRREGG